MSLCVLIVDDEEDARAIAQLALEMQTDWTVLSVGSGAEALDVAASQNPDVILLDVMMPEMDGLETLKQLRDNPASAKIPVIFMTAKVHPAEQEKLKQRNVTAVFAKPYRPLQLADQILTALEP